MRRLRGFSLLRSSAGAFALLALLSFSSARVALGQAERLIHSFGSPGDGSDPHSCLISDSHGNLYGVTYGGGAYGGGTVFELSPPAQGQTVWTETILHNFQGPPSDGWTPTAGVALDKSGNVYGAAAGGASNLGMVYELSPPSAPGGAWTESILYNFAYHDGGTTGKNPGGVALVRNDLYVTTQYGGPVGANGIGNGNVLELRPPTKAGGAWLAEEIFAFNGGDQGGGPLSQGGALVSDASGNLYGTAGVALGTIAVFELSPPSPGSAQWTEGSIYFFQSSTIAPLILDQAGNLYGTAGDLTPGGSSIVFELSPPASAGGSWTGLTLYTFNPGSPQNGSVPYAGLVLGKAGNLYGTTVYGGSSTQCGTNGCGTVFELSPTIPPPWTETVLHDFSDNLRDGDGPVTNLTIDPAGHLYGVTQGGGAYNGGAAFEVAP